MNASHYIHRTPYAGCVTTAHTINGTSWVDYQSEPITLADYLAANPDQVATEPEAFDKVLFDYYASRCTPAKPITLDRWEYALEVLPPRKWRKVDGVEMFHVSEHLDGPLVYWYTRMAGQCFEIVDVANAAMETIVRKTREAVEAVA